MITVDEYFSQHGIGHEDEWTDEIQNNVEILLGHVNAMLDEFGENRGLRSGWRPKSVNDRIPNASRKSKHITGQAVDIEDDDGRLKEFALARDTEQGYTTLERYGLYAEYGDATPTWLHVQIIPPGSGKRVYYPNAAWAARAVETGRLA